LSRIADNLQRVRDRVRAAASRVGRSPHDVEICVVTKQVDVSAIRQAFAAGARVLGENRVQVAEGKVLRTRDLQVRWHFIGHLQRNKARRAVELFDAIESVDGIPLAARLSDLGIERGAPVPILLEVRTSDEGTKGGFPVAETLDAVAEIRELPGVVVRGLMTMAPFTDDEALIRRSFRSLRRLADEGFPEGSTLSMGMTQDFELAVEEGATRIRVGSAIFS
jgi:pyridoxal phosphate enzyme (YggS family)